MLWASFWALGLPAFAGENVYSSLLEKGSWVLPGDRTLGDEEEPAGTPVEIQSGQTGQPQGLKLPVSFPGWSDVECRGSLDLRDIQEIAVEVLLPKNAPADVQVVLYLKDQDHLWYQNENREYVSCGENVRRVFSLSPRQGNWKPEGHFKAWDPYNLGGVRTLGVRLQSNQTFKGEAFIGSVEGLIRPPEALIELQDFLPSSDVVRCYDLFEVSFTLPKTYDNPFNPAEISVIGDFQTPSGKLLSVPAFFSQPFCREKRWGKEKLSPMGHTVWKIRFSPTEAGPHSYVIRIQDGQEVSTAARRFEALPSKGRGFVKVDKDQRGFEFDDGSPFYPIGHVIRSAADDRMAYDYEFEPLKGWGTYAYDEYFKRMQEEGISFCRIWMCSWWLALEWNAQWPGFRGLGQYNLENAWRVDKILSEAAKRGIYVELTLTNHGQWSPHIDTEWEPNPYNVANGGFLNKPDEFFSDARARQLTRDRHRYSAARWGSYASLMAWALFSEVEWVAPWFRGLDNPALGDRQIVADWHRDMAQVLRATDPWCHIITTQFAFPSRGAEVWVLPEIEFVQANGYTGYPILKATNAPQAFYNYYFNFVAQFKKPVLVGEYGGHWETNTPDQLNVQLHTGCWGAFMTPMAGFGGYWWWPYIHEKNLYSHMGALARYAAGEDRRGIAWEVVKPPVDPPGCGLLSQGLKSTTKAYLWVVQESALNTWEGIPVVAGAQVGIEGLQDGQYEVEFWDTYQGKPTHKIVVASNQGKVICVLPPVDKDLAIKLKHETLWGG